MPFDPTQPFATYSNDVGNIYRLQGGTYYDPNGNAVSPLPATWPPSIASQPVWQSFTYAQLPAASGFSGYTVFVSDWGAYGTLARSNGTRWLPVGGRVLLKHLGAAVAGVANSEQIALQTPAMPIGSVQAGDQIRFEIDGTAKSGTTDSMTAAFRAGTAGTTADTSIITPTFLTAANQTGSALFAFKVVTTTSLLRVGPASVGGGLYAQSSTTAAGAATTISDVSANVMFFSLGILSSGATNTVAIQEGSIWQIVN